MASVFTSPLIRFTTTLALVGGVAVAASGGRAAAVEPIIERVSVSSSGAQVAGVSTMAAISSDGQVVAFVSSAASLVAGDTNGRQDVFVRDRSTGLTTRASVTSSGAQTSVGGVGTLVGAVAISGDGRLVAFLSNASDVVPGDTNATYDAFVHDRISGVTSRVSVTSGGAQAQSTSDDLGISSDGRYVMFRSGSTTLTGGSGTHVFVHDRTTGVTTAATTNATGAGVHAAISPDGRYVVFISSTPAQVYVRDMQLTQNVLVSVASDGTAGNQASSEPVVSRGGRFVAFTSAASNLVPGDTNGVPDTFVHDVVTGETTRVNLTSAGGQAMGGLSFQGLPSISDDGRYVAFSSVATNLAPNDSNGAIDVFVHDRLTHATDRVSVSSAGLQANNFSNQAAITADGGFVAFHSRASNLVPGDTNAQEDVFVRKLLVTGDSTPPDISYTVTPAEPDGDGEWFRGDVQLDWTVVDEQSAIDIIGCADQIIVVDQPRTEYACSATSSGGTAEPVSVIIGRDATRPTVQTTATPAAPDGDNGWYVSPPLLAYSCTDATSGIADCPADYTVSEGSAHAIQRSALDRAGNTEVVLSGPFNVDLTDPAVTCAQEPAYLLNQPGTVSGTVTDGTSGPRTALAVADVATTSAGRSLAAVTGRDVAGRTAEAMCGFRVEYGFSGFRTPVDNDAVNISKAGTAVPLKWQLIDYFGEPVTDLSSVSVTSSRHACDGGAPEDLIEEVATGASGLQNLGDGNYQFNWKSQKSYAGTCRTLQLDLGELRLRQAEFRFKS